MYVCTYVSVTLRNVNCAHAQELITRGCQWRTGSGEGGGKQCFLAMEDEEDSTAGPSQQT